MYISHPLIFAHTIRDKQHSRYIHIYVHIYINVHRYSTHSQNQRQVIQQTSTRTHTNPTNNQNAISLLSLVCALLCPACPLPSTPVSHACSPTSYRKHTHTHTHTISGIEKGSREIAEFNVHTQAVRLRSQQISHSCGFSTRGARERERERERESERARERARERESVIVCVCVCIFSTRCAAKEPCVFQ